MKTLSCTANVIIVSLSSFLATTCSGQNVNVENKSALGSASEEFHPAIRASENDDAVAARQVVWRSGGIEIHQLVLINKASKEAIVANSTNDVCFFHGKLFTAAPDGPNQAAYIIVSRPFGTNEFTAAAALAFRAGINSDYRMGKGPPRTRINLESLLQHEKESSHDASGTPLRHVELTVESERLVLHFESFTGVNGKVVLDDQLNPISMTTMRR